MKTCSQCSLGQPLDNFHKDRRSKDGRARKCKSCVSAYQDEYRARHSEMIAMKKRNYAIAKRKAESARHRAWARRNRDANVAYHRDWHLRRKYNLSVDEWEALFKAQGRVCAICGTNDPARSWGAGGWHTDHCHKNGHVRGILCHHCNLALGHIKDSPALALKLYSYLGGESAAATLLAARDVEEPTSPSVATGSPFGI